MDSQFIPPKMRLASLLAMAICFALIPSRGEGAPHTETKPVKKDTIFIQRDTVYIQAPAAATKRKSDRLPDVTLEELEYKHGRAAKMQSTGFGLLMGGIGAVGGGIAMMVMGASQANRTTYDQYGYETTTTDGEGLIVGGYLLAVLAGPPLITTGIILNRIGNGKRKRLERMIDEYPDKVSLEIGVNSVKLSVRF